MRVVVEADVLAAREWIRDSGRSGVAVSLPLRHLMSCYLASVANDADEYRRGLSWVDYFLEAGELPESVVTDPEQRRREFVLVK